MSFFTKRVGCSPTMFGVLWLWYFSKLWKSSKANEIQCVDEGIFLFTEIHFNDSHPALQVLLSGGVDSTVCTALLNRALNQDQVIAVHIDNGFMRKRESQSVEEALKKLGIQVKGTTALPSSWIQKKKRKKTPEVPVCFHNASFCICKLVSFNIHLF